MLLDFVDWASRFSWIPRGGLDHGELCEFATERTWYFTAWRWTWEYPAAGMIIILKTLGKGRRSVLQHCGKPSRSDMNHMDSFLFLLCTVHCVEKHYS